MNTLTINLLNMKARMSKMATIKRSRSGYSFKQVLLIASAVFSGIFCAALNAQILDTDLAGGAESHANMPPYTTLNYRIATDANMFAADNGDTPTLLGEVRAFAFDNTTAVPGFTLADGRLLDIATNASLFAVVGTSYGGNGTTNFALPDLRSRAPICTGSGPGLSEITIGQQVGAEMVKLSKNHLAGHTHTTADGPTESTGNNSAHQNLPPSLGLHCLLVARGNASYPNRSGSASSTPDQLPVVAEIKIHAGLNPDFNETESCLGQLLAISSNTALFSLVGTTYGGNGRTSFGVPDLRGRSIVHHGVAEGGIPSSVLGQKTGASSVILSTSNLAQHTHNITNSDPATDTSLTGSDIAHTNQAPFLAVSTSITTSEAGLAPSTAATALNAATPVIGQIRYFAANFALAGHSETESQLLSNTTFPTLFSLLGTTFGGNGSPSFGIPNNINRITLGNGAGSELSVRNIADTGGSHQHVLTLNQMAKHRHGKDLSELCWAMKSTSAGVALCL